MKYTVKERDDLKQKLETSYEALQRVRDERNEAWTKLEKVRKLCEQMLDSQETDK